MCDNGWPRQLGIRIATGKSRLFAQVRSTCARVRNHDRYMYSSAALSRRKNTLAETSPAMNVRVRVAQAATGREGSRAELHTIT